MRFDTKVILEALNVSLPHLYSQQITVTTEFDYLSFREYKLNKSACNPTNSFLSSAISSQIFNTRINIC